MAVLMKAARLRGAIIMEKTLRLYGDFGKGSAGSRRVDSKNISASLLRFDDRVVEANDDLSRMWDTAVTIGLGQFGVEGTDPVECVIGQSADPKS